MPCQQNFVQTPPRDNFQLERTHRRHTRPLLARLLVPRTHSQSLHLRLPPRRRPRPTTKSRNPQRRYFVHLIHDGLPFGQSVPSLAHPSASLLALIRAPPRPDSTRLDSTTHTPRPVHLHSSRASACPRRPHAHACACQRRYLILSRRRARARAQTGGATGNDLRPGSLLHLALNLGILPASSTTDLHHARLCLTFSTAPSQSPLLPGIPDGPQAIHGPCCRAASCALPD